MLSGGAFYGLNSYRHSNTTFEYHRRQLELLEHLTIAVADLQTPPIPEVAETKDPLQTYLDRLAKIAACVDRYCRNLESAVAQKVDIGDAEGQFGEFDKLRDLVEQIVAKAKRESNPRISLSGGETNWLGTDDFRTEFVHIPAALGRLRGKVHDSIRKNVAEDKANYRTAIGIVYSTSVLVVLLLVLLVWLGYRAVFFPIRVDWASPPHRECSRAHFPRNSPI